MAHRSERNTSEDHKNILDVQRAENLPSLFLRGRHGRPNGSDMGVVPGIVIDYNSAVSHGGGLVAIIPP